MATKERHNITISPDVWRMLQLLSRLQGKSASELLEDAVKELVTSGKYNPAYIKIMSSVSAVDDKENAELTKLLDSLTEDDLDVVEKYSL